MSWFPLGYFVMYFVVKKSTTKDTKVPIAIGSPRYHKAYELIRTSPLAFNSLLTDRIQI